MTKANTERRGLGQQHRPEGGQGESPAAGTAETPRGQEAGAPPDAPRPEDYSGAFVEFAIVAGADAAAKLVEKWGGKLMDIPQRARGSLLEEVIGPSAAARICAEFPGERMHIPVQYVAMKRERNRRILDARASGKSIKAIAEEFSLTERSIYYILNPADDSPEEDSA